MPGRLRFVAGLVILERLLKGGIQGIAHGLPSKRADTGSNQRPYRHPSGSRQSSHCRPGGSTRDGPHRSSHRSTHALGANHVTRAVLFSSPMLRPLPELGLHGRILIFSHAPPIRRGRAGAPGLCFPRSGTPRGGRCAWRRGNIARDLHRPSPAFQVRFPARPGLPRDVLPNPPFDRVGMPPIFAEPRWAKQPTSNPPSAPTPQVTGPRRR